MADTFISVDVETDEQTLADGAITDLQTRWPGWTPNEADLEVVQIETIAPMAAEAARAASIMPGAAFRAILTRLHGIPQIEGIAATGLATFELSEAHLIPAGFAIDVDGYEFTVDEDQPAAGTTVTAVPITASVAGTAANDLPGDSVAPVTSSTYVDSVDLDEPTAGGADGETDEDFQDRGSLELELQGETLVTDRDYEIMAVTRFPASIAAATVVRDDAARELLVVVKGHTGGLVSLSIRNQLAALYEEYRQTTWDVTIDNAADASIAVAFEIHPYPGYDNTALLASCVAAIQAYLDPVVWGQPREYGDVKSTRWINEPIVRKNKIIDLLGDVQGVDYVGDVTITSATGAAVGDDWDMSDGSSFPVWIAKPVPGGINGTII